VFQRHGIGRVELSNDLRREDIAPFISLLLQEAPEEDPFDRFQSRLSASLTSNITVEPVRGMEQLEDPSDADRAKEAAKLTYFQSVHVAQGGADGRAPRPRRQPAAREARRAVDRRPGAEQRDVDARHDALRDYDEYTFTHCVNVCIISVVIGQKLGLSKTQLYELGLGALFHDIGKQRIDPSRAQQDGGLDEHEWAADAAAPDGRAARCSRMRGWRGAVPRHADGVRASHEDRPDGYPRNMRERSRRCSAGSSPPPTASMRRPRSAATSSSPGRRRSAARDARQPARGYDPLLVKALINVTGVFPVGTLAILDTFELAVVVARNPGPEAAAPAGRQDHLRRQRRHARRAGHRST
jgi:hypothetical protein